MALAARWPLPHQLQQAMVLLGPQVQQLLLLRMGTALHLLAAVWEGDVDVLLKGRAAAEVRGGEERERECVS